ncbi:unnamed protein product [Onchocerca flexuosa]|uniref:Uncharacterized protein n=1 Tax=Onchocerca flexuosa TaxID=387005 RepID=A0A183HLA9_9BILA|nr:unnamed protein product [Onchocerca flexuosa]
MLTVRNITRTERQLSSNPILEDDFNGCASDDSAGTTAMGSGKRTTVTKGNEGTFRDHRSSLTSGAIPMEKLKQNNRE